MMTGYKYSYNNVLSLWFHNGYDFINSKNDKPLVFKTNKSYLWMLNLLYDALDLKVYVVKL